jgi:integral membrane protein
MSNSITYSNLLAFRIIALIEGISYLLLLGIAMPLKYISGNLLVMKYMGWAHGILFILYCIFLLQVWKELSWKFSRVIWVFLASLVPFGTFYLEYKLKKEFRR